MKVNKTTILERQIYKFSRALDAKSRMLDNVTAHAYTQIIKKEPQTLINEQKLFKAIGPTIHDDAKKAINIKEVIKYIKQNYGKMGVTEMVRAFFAHPAGITFRLMQDAVIDCSDTNLYEDYLHQLIMAQKRSEIPAKQWKHIS